MLVFTTEEHGFRLQTLLNKIDELEYSILIVKTTNGEVSSFFSNRKEMMCHRSSEDSVRVYGLNVINEHISVLVNHFYSL